MPKHGGRRRKTRTHRATDTGTALLQPPKSFVIRKGKTAKSVAQLAKDIRLMMLPYTAKNLKERKSNVLKDFIAVASPLGVTHMLVVSQRASNVYLKMIKLSKGPTFVFEVLDYSLMRDVRAGQKGARTTMKDYEKPPLMVLNGFKAGPKVLKEEGEGGEGPDLAAIDRMKNYFISMFPSIDIREVKIDNASKRVVLFHQLEPGVVELRQFAIVRQLAGVNKAVASLYMQARSLNSRRVDMQEVAQLAEEVKKVKEEPPSSEDEADSPQAALKNPIKISPVIEIDNLKVQLSLVELGPRIKMRLIRIETGCCGGEVESLMD